MAVTSVNDIWNLICEECKKIITSVAFDCFLGDLVPVSFSSGVLTLSCKEEYGQRLDQNRAGSPDDVTAEAIGQESATCANSYGIGPG